LVYEDLTYGFIKKRFLFWSKEMGLTAELNFKAMTRCWGVCYHYKKKINLATRLGGRSKEAIDYVIVHELSHLQHPNHSKAFWFLVSQYISDWKKYRHYDTI
jgi:predicted metal-dependent hydrolase